MNIPRIRIANLPTPVEDLPRLSSKLGGIRISVKRDDLTGLGMGGNKVRKLELLLAEAMANGAKTLITSGAIQSNHCRQTAAVAAKFGLDCILVLAGEKPDRVSGNLLLDQLFGAEIVYTEKENRETMSKEVFLLAWEAGKRPFQIPYGGSSPIGALGYALAMEELLDQSVQPDVIIFASSSGGTQAGMLVGARKTGYNGKLLGISVDESVDSFIPKIVKLANESAERIGMQSDFTFNDVQLNSEYIGGGYGIFNHFEKEAIDLFAASEGILLDPVYTGRAAAGMIDLIRCGRIKPDEQILFWHTGGTPALFAEQYSSKLVG